VAELLIVDEAPFRRALRRTLERSGHRVLEAGTVLEAIRAAHPDPSHP
jgi:ActR/RegA family two-component response regulator